MIGLNRKKGTKVNSKVRILCLFLAVVFVLSQADNLRIVNAAGAIYVDRIAGLNSNSGDSPRSAVQSLRRAQELLEDDGTIYVRMGEEWLALEEAKTVKEDKAFADGKWQSQKELAPVVIDKETSEASLEVMPEVTEQEVEEVAPEKEASEEAGQVADEVPAEEAPTVEAPVEDDAIDKEATPVEDVPEEGPALDEQIDEDLAPEINGEEDTTDNSEPTPDVAGEEEVAVADEASESTTEDETNDEVATEEVVSEETKEKIEALTKLLDQVTVMVEESEDFDNVVDATKSYEALNEEVKARVPDGVYKRLRASQIVVANSNRMSAGFSVVGDLPWYVEFRVVEKEGSGTFDFGDSIGSYELTLWNTLTDEPYELNGQKVTVTVPIDNVNKYKDISVIHYLPDGGHEVLKVSRVKGENAISFETTSFSPYEIVGNTGDVYDQSGTQSSGSGSKPSGGTSSNSGTSSSGTSNSGTSKNGTTSSGSGTSSNTSGQTTVTPRSVGAKTGDDNNILMLVGIGALAVVAVGGLIYFKKKKK